MSERYSGLSPAALWHRLGLAHHNWPGRFTVLLATILLLLVTQPMFSGHAFAQNIATATISLVLLAALYAFRATRIYFIVALVLLVPSLGGRLALLFTPSLDGRSAQRDLFVPVPGRDRHRTGFADCSS